MLTGFAGSAPESPYSPYSQYIDLASNTSNFNENFKNRNGCLVWFLNAKRRTLNRPIGFEAWIFLENQVGETVCTCWRARLQSLLRLTFPGSRLMLLMRAWGSRAGPADAHDARPLGEILEGVPIRDQWLVTDHILCF